MFSKLLLLFIGIPLIELAILVELGRLIGFWPTIGLVVLTGALGASLARYQGFMVYSRIQTELRWGRIPTSEMIDGLLILIGGIVLLTPGILTDIFGFALLVPWIRDQFKSWLRKKFNHFIQTGQSSTFTGNINLPPNVL